VKFITNLINKYNKPLSLKFFNNTNLFTYNIFNALYKKLIAKRDKVNILKRFIEDGYQKIGNVPKSFINDINSNLRKQNPNNVENPLFRYEVDREIEQLTKDMIEKNFSNIIEEMEEFYQASMKLTYIRINRNHGYESNEEKFSNYFHTDGYIFTMIKFFINLHDVTEKHGPLELIKKRNAKDFLKLNYKINEFRIFPSKNEKNNELIYKNTGKQGDVLICRTTELLHRASKPDINLFRDMLFLEFVLVPKKNEYKKNIFSICENSPDYLKKLDNPVSKKLSKIKGITNLFKVFLEYKNSSKIIQI